VESHIKALVAMLGIHIVDTDDDDNWT
jgi:hypothetical protein